jgi:hypothetical protein
VEEANGSNSIADAEIGAEHPRQCADVCVTAMAGGRGASGAGSAAIGVALAGAGIVAVAGLALGSYVVQRITEPRVSQDDDGGGEQQRRRSRQHWSWRRRDATHALHRPAGGRLAPLERVGRDV